MFQADKNWFKINKIVVTVICEIKKVNIPFIESGSLYF